MTTDVQALIDATFQAGVYMAAEVRNEQAVTDNWYASKATHEDVIAARGASERAAYEFGRAIGRLKEAVR